MMKCWLEFCGRLAYDMEGGKRERKRTFSTVTWPIVKSRLLFSDTNCQWQSGPFQFRVTEIKLGFSGVGSCVQKSKRKLLFIRATRLQTEKIVLRAQSLDLGGLCPLLHCRQTPVV